jgi:hypothetical protein
VPTPPKRKPSPAREQSADLDNDDRQQCAYCRQNFAADRIAPHEEVCQKVMAKKAKVFDAKEQTLQETEALKFALNSSRDPPKKDSNYMREHQKLRDALRTARKLAE